MTALGPDSVIQLNCSRRGFWGRSTRSTTSAAGFPRCEFMLQSNGCVALQKRRPLRSRQAATAQFEVSSLLHSICRLTKRLRSRMARRRERHAVHMAVRLRSTDPHAASEAVRHFPMSGACATWLPHLLSSDHDTKPVSRNSAFLEKLAIRSDAGDSPAQTGGSRAKCEGQRSLWEDSLSLSPCVWGL